MKKLMLKKIMTMILLTSLVMQMVPLNVFAITEMGTKDSVSVSFSSNLEENEEKITIIVEPQDELVTVSGIALPNGDFVEGNNADFIATENGDYDFEVFYQKIITPEIIPPVEEEIIPDVPTILPEVHASTDNEALANAETLEIPQNIIVEGSKVFTYKVTGIEVIAKATADEYFVFDADTGTITTYLMSSPTQVIIPSEIGGVAVTTIGEEAFFERHLTSVVIPDSVTTIGDSAFNTNRLSSVVIPNSVNTIGKNAFFMNDLTSVVIPNRLLLLVKVHLTGTT